MLRGSACLIPPMRNAPGKYTLDQLLEMKRAERPSSEFWTRFDDEIRIRQRRMLQDQPVDDLGSELSFWRRLRPTGSLVMAATACGIVSLVAVRMLNPAEQIDAPATATFATVDTPALPEQTEILPEFDSPAPAAPEPVFIEVAAAPVAIEPSNDELLRSTPQPATVVANHSDPSPVTDLSDFTLEITTPFKSLDIEEAIAFYADADSQPEILERYTHPLSDRGWSFNQYVSNETDPLNRVTAVALQSKLFGERNRSERKLNALTLRF